MNITIFGGSGRSGQLLVEQALEKGHLVTALVRNPAKITLKNDRLTLIQGDVKDAQAVARALEGSSAVISVLGPTSNEPVFEVSQGMQNILTGMKSLGMRRLIITAGAGVGDPLDSPGLMNHMISFMLKVMAKNVLADMTRVVELVRGSDLDWSVVRLPMLVDGPSAGPVKAGYLGKGVGTRITRADAAAFILEVLEKGAFIRKSPVISN